MKSKNKIYNIMFCLVAAMIIYFNLDKGINYIFYSIFNADKNAKLTEVTYFFVYEVPKVLLLLGVISFFVGIINSFFAPEKIRKIMGDKPLIFGNIVASLLGIVTPFCSCSAIPLFLGFVEAGIPLGVTFSFLISAPMINEVALVLLWSMFGMKTALIYISTGLFISVISGWVIGKLKLEKYVEKWVYDVKMGVSESQIELTFEDRLNSGVKTVKSVVGKVWYFIVLGIGVGAFVHGYVPQNFMASIMGKSVWYSVPLSVIIGIPLYMSSGMIIPVVCELINKGASLGTALAFMMSVIGLSLPEIIILKKVLKTKLIVIFTGIVAIGIIVVGYLFNILF